MQTVSEKFNPYADVRRIRVDISHRMVDETAADVGTPSASGESKPSQVAQVMDYDAGGVMVKTLEHNAFLLDGNATILLPTDVTPYHTGWWSDSISGDDGSFDVPPTLDFVFSSPISCVGFSVKFNAEDEDGAVHSYRIDTFDAGGAPVSSGTFTNHSMVSVAELPSDHVSTVRFTFLSTRLPYRRARVGGVLFGMIQQYGNANIYSVDAVHEIAPLMDRFPANQLEFVFDNSDQKYNFLNPDSIYRFLNEDQVITMRLLINGEECFMGRYMFIGSNTESDGMTARISAGSWAYALEGRYNLGESGSWTFLEALESIRDESGLPFEIDVPPEIASRVVGKAIPRNTMSKNAIALFAQAARCVAYFDRNNVLVAREISFDGAESKEHFTKDNMRQMPSVSLHERVNRVVVHVSDSYSGDEKYFSKQEVASGDSIRTKTFENPVAYDGKAVAQWLYDVCQNEITFSVYARGNPALDPMDAVMVDSDFGVSSGAVVTRIETTFDGGMIQQLSADGKRYGG